MLQKYKASLFSSRLGNVKTSFPHFARSLENKTTMALPLLFLVYIIPLTVHASAHDIQGVISTIGSILNDFVIPLIIGLAFVVFLWGVFKYITAASAEGKEGARVIIIYGLIGLFIMLAAWGLVNILIVTFFGVSGPAIAPPFIPGVPSI